MSDVTYCDPQGKPIHIGGGTKDPGIIDSVGIAETVALTKAFQGLVYGEVRMHRSPVRSKLRQVGCDTRLRDSPITIGEAAVF